MYKEETIIINTLGIHARPASLLAQNASKFSSEVWIDKDGMRVNAKSVMGILMLMSPQGTKLIIEAKGEDEKEAVEKLISIIEDKFGEE